MSKVRPRRLRMRRAPRPDLVRRYHVELSRTSSAGHKKKTKIAA